jgi:hypothetical protein
VTEQLVAEVEVRQSGLHVVEFSPTMRAVASNFREVDGETGPEGVADLMVAVFDLPDTAPAVGNDVRQKIDPGSFRTWIDRLVPEFTLPFMRDHGNAHLFGYVDSSLIIGFSRGYREGSAEVKGKERRGLLAEHHWNLRTDEGRNAFERARFDPLNVQVSFRWTKDEVYRGRDGFEHVSAFEDMIESSQVGMGAQNAAGLVANTLRSMAAEEARRVIAVDGLRAETPTEPEPDPEPEEEAPPAAEAHVSREAVVDEFDRILGRMTKGQLADHMGTEHKGAYREGMSKSEMESAHEADHASGDVGHSHEGMARHQYHGDKTPRKPSKSLMSEWLKDDDFRDMVKGMVRGAVVGGDVAARTWSVETFEERIGCALQGAADEYGSNWCFCAEVFVEDNGLTRGWLVAAIYGSLVIDEGGEDPETAIALGGGSEGMEWYRIDWTGDSPDVNGVPEVFTFDFPGAVEVERRWEPASTPIRAAGGLVADWLAEAQVVPNAGVDVDLADPTDEWYLSLFGQRLA